MSEFSLPIILLVTGLFLLVAELFIPSGGLLAILSASSLIASVVTAFMAGGPTLGMTFLGVIAVALPVVLFAAVKYWPDTPMGRLILVTPPEHPDDVLPDSEEYRRVQSLVGHDGIAQTSMLPSGGVLIDGKIYDALSQGEAIEQGDLVRVIEVSGNHIVVRKITADSVAISDKEGEKTSSSPAPDTYLEDPFDNPLA